MTLLALASLAFAFAQTGPIALEGSKPLTLNAEAAPSPPRHAGTYHVSSGTWTRSPAPSAAFGPDIIYSNTAFSGYFYNCEATGGNARGALHYDEGGLPGTTNGDPFTGTPDRDNYNVNGFSIGYCDFAAPGTGGWTIDFYESYQPCTIDTSPDVTIALSGLPAAGDCWIIDIDLTGGQEFCMGADGGDGWDNDASLDSFGWSFRYNGVSTTGAGFLITGNPDVTCPTGQPNCGANTYFGTSLCPGEGTGYLTRDFWFLEDNGPIAGCYFFGGYRNNVPVCGGNFNPMASFHMDILAAPGECGPSCICNPSFCLSNATSTGAPAELELFGSPVAADDNLRLAATGVPQQSFGFFATSLTPGFAAYPGGSQGNLCLAGEIGRFVASGQIKNSGNAGEISIDTQLGEWSVQAIPSPTGSYAAGIGTTSHFQLWFRDSIAGVPTSNFSHGAAVTWQ